MYCGYLELRMECLSEKSMYQGQCRQLMQLKLAAGTDQEGREK